MEENYDLEEIEYTGTEEMEVVKEIRLGLLTEEIRRTLTKRELLDWFARLSISRRGWCDNITCNDLIHIAKECGLKIYGGKRK